MPRPVLLITSIRLAGGAIAAAAVTLAACQKAAPTETATADAIVVVQGAFQSAQFGRELASPVVLRVVDKNGAGMPKVQVTLAIVEGGGAVNPTSAITDSKGEISAKWTMGAAQPGQTIAASAPGVSAVRVQATSLLPTDIIIAQGNNQSAKAGNALTNSIVIRVVSNGNVPMAGVPVGFQVTGGGGAISPQSALTSSLGEVTAKWTLGTAIGINTAAVVVSTIAPTTLVASGTP